MKRLKVLICLIIFFIGTAEAYSADYYELGKLYYYKNNYEYAKYYFEKAINENPSNVNCRYYYAQSLVFLDDFDSAQNQYQKVIEISPQSNAAKYSTQAISNLQKHYNFQDKKIYSSIGNAYSSSYTSKNNFGINYLENALTSSGDVLIWDTKSMPIKVYFMDGKKTQGFKPEFVSDVKNALDEWKKATDNIIDFKYSYNKKDADMIISFESSLSNNNNSKGFLAGLTKPYPKGNFLDNVTMRFATTRPDKKPITSNAVFNTALHEIGHSLGIWGHSSTDGDIMYAVKHEEQDKTLASLSERDMNTIKMLYSMESNELKNIVANNGSNKSSKGDTQKVILENKLKEAQEYVKKVPNDPISWTQLATAYNEMGETDKAIENFEKALVLDENYKSANAGLAEIYTKKNELKKGEKYYNILIKNAPTDRTNYHNLAILYLNNKMYNNAKYTINKIYAKDFSSRKDPRLQSLMQKIENESK